MIEEKRYYTPDISEFHVGFQLQLLNSEGMYEWGDYTIEEDWATPPWIEAIELETVRVKHLDKEDIEAEGWEQTREDTFSKRYTDPRGVNDTIHLVKRDIVLIAIGDSETSYDEWKTIFRGQILNRSELKFQMKRLGIV